MSAQSVKQALGAFSKYQRENRNFGTCDSEPLYVVSDLLKATIKGKRPTVPTTAQGWQIYATKEGSEPVAAELGRLMTVVVEEIGKTTVFESNTPEFKNVIESYTF